NGEYLNLSGTSMAAPHVAGAVAILRQFNPEATVEEIKTALMFTARDLGPTGEDNTYGWGLIDIPKAMEFLVNPSVVTFNSSSQEFPRNFSLLGNYPNPFNPCTRIAYSVNEPGTVTLEILNLLGEQVTILESGYKYPGQYVTIWDSRSNGGDKVSSGLYFYRLSLGDEYRLGRMTLVR
ncbi:MAG: S8 family serine peptidase, partial [bacterium]